MSWRSHKLVNLILVLTIIEKFEEYMEGNGFERLQSLTGQLNWGKIFSMNNIQNLGIIIMDWCNM